MFRRGSSVNSVRAAFSKRVKLLIDSRIRVRRPRRRSSTPRGSEDGGGAKRGQNKLTSVFSALTQLGTARRRQRRRVRFCFAGAGRFCRFLGSSKQFVTVLHDPGFSHSRVRGRCGGLVHHFLHRTRSIGVGGLVSRGGRVFLRSFGGGVIGR